MAISKSGEKLAAISQVNGRRMLLILTADMALEKASGIDDLKIRGIEWIGDEAVLVDRSFTQDLGVGFTTNQFEARTAMVLPSDKSGESWQVFADDQSVGNAIFGQNGLRLVDGRWTGYFRGIELQATANRGFIVRTGSTALYAVDMETGKTKMFARTAPRGYYRQWRIDGNGEIAATFDLDRRDGSWSIVNGKGRTLASGVDREGDASLVAIGHGGDTLIYAAENPDTEFMDLYEVALDGSGTPAKVFADINVDGFLRDPATGRMIGYMAGGARPKPVLFDAGNQEAADKLFAAFGKLNVTLVDWSSDFRTFLVRTSGNGDSGSWYVVDVANRTAKPLGVERARIPPDAVGPISTVTYTSGDGLEMDGILTLPPGRDAKNLPVIMFPHGGPAGQDDPEFDWWAQAFASRGYAVFQPNFRGSTNRTEKFRQASRGEWGRKMQSDISDGLAELVRQGIADPKRACIMGASYGGYAALAGVTLQLGLYRCAVAVAPVADLPQMFSSELRASGNSNLLYRSLREELGSRSSLEDVSPRHHAARADAPILLVHGDKDTVVPFEQSERMANALKGAGKTYEMVVLDGEDHWLSQGDKRNQMLAAAMAFIQKHNPPD